MAMRFDEILGVKDLTLDEIALSLNPRPDKDSTGHGYTAYYDRHFSPLRDKSIKLLEIGVWEGASLAMWSRYFERALIVGADIDITRCKSVPDRCRLWEMNQSSKESLINMALELGPWSVVIDDGSHVAAHQLLTFKTLWNYVEPGGIYAIEDLHVNYRNGYTRAMVDYIGGELQADVHAHGKLKFADARNCPPEERGRLTEMEASIQAIHIYRHLCVIEKAS